MKMAIKELASTWGAVLVEDEDSFREERAFFEDTGWGDTWSPEQWFGHLMVTAPCKILWVSPEESDLLLKEIVAVILDRYAEWPRVTRAMETLRTQVSDWEALNKS